MLSENLWAVDKKRFSFYKIEKMLKSYLILITALCFSGLFLC